MRTLAIRNLIAMCCLAAAFILLTGRASYAQLECNIVSASASTTGSIAAGDTAQTSRMFRDGRNTTCTFNRTQTTSAGAYLSDSYTFTNTTGSTACVFVDLNATGCGVATNQISVAAYLGSYNPASILTNIIADPGLSTGGNFATSMSFSVAAGATYVIVVHNINSGTFCPSYSFTRRVANGCRQPGYDAANDGSADIAVFRPGAFATWYWTTLSGTFQGAQFGTTGDIPVAGDYNGDEMSDFAVFRPSTGTWYTSAGSATNYDAFQWGLSGDVPVPGDYDGDGTTDRAVFRPSNNVWYILRSSDSTVLYLAFGAAGDKVVPADYDGDGRTDPAIYRPTDGLWAVQNSGGNFSSLYSPQNYGGNVGDIPVPADYDGDGKADHAIFRPGIGTWFIFRTSVTSGQQQTAIFGASGDIPQPADYDGDGKADLAVFRPSNNSWYLRRSTAGDIALAFGTTGDQPVSAANLTP